jgi:hypothetical protein
MGHVALHRFHQSRDEIVPALELNVDLGKGVDIGVPQPDQSVVESQREAENSRDDETITSSSIYSLLRFRRPMRQDGESGPGCVEGLAETVLGRPLAQTLTANLIANSPV